MAERHVFICLDEKFLNGHFGPRIKGIQPRLGETGVGHLSCGKLKRTSRFKCNYPSGEDGVGDRAIPTQEVRDPCASKPPVRTQEEQIANRTNDVVTKRTYDVLPTVRDTAVDPSAPRRYVAARPSVTCFTCAGQELNIAQGT